MNDEDAFQLIEELAEKYGLDGEAGKDEIVGYMHYTFRFTDRPDEGCNMRIVEGLNTDESEAIIGHKMRELGYREGNLER